MKKRTMQVCRLFFCAYFSAFMVTPLYAQSGEPHQNAVLEGVQFSSEETGRADETEYKRSFASHGILSLFLSLTGIDRLVGICRINMKDHSVHRTNPNPCARWTA